VPANCAFAIMIARFGHRSRRRTRHFRITAILPRVRLQPALVQGSFLVVPTVNHPQDFAQEMEFLRRAGHFEKCVGLL